MTERRRITTLDKLKVMIRQARCPLCGEKLGGLDQIDFDHEHALVLGGADDLDNLRAVHRDCHKVKTHGNGATNRGSDRGEAARGNHLSDREADFRAALLRKDAGQAPPPSKWPRRPLQSRNDLRRTR